MTGRGDQDDGTVVLGIETSCDETAASLVRATTQGLPAGSVNGEADTTRPTLHRASETVRFDVLSSVVSSQVDRHARYGGVVPEIASRAHVELLTPAVAQAVVEAGVDESEIDVVAATVGPGLVGALLVGVSTAKALALVWGVPFVGVNHMEAHLYAALLEEPDIELPMVVLLVSGGHTLLVLMEDHGRYRLLGQTVDDAGGEAFDKVARFLGLGYPGGPIVDRMAMDGDPDAIRFPRGMLEAGFDFSFSGLKTAVINHARRHPEARVNDICASFQAAVVDVLVTKARRAAQEFGVGAMALGGGVAANSALREQFLGACAEDGIHGFLPSLSMCTDNAAMVAAAGWWRLRADGPTTLEMGADPNMAIPGLR